MVEMVLERIPKGVVISSMDMKRTFRRFGALALAVMMTFCLAATPAFAQGTGGTGDAKIVVNGAIKGATYKAYQILKLTNFDLEEGRYEYEIVPGTTNEGETTDAPITEALRKLIGKGKEFEVKRENDKVTGAGFEFYKDGKHVAFWVPLAENHSHTDACYTDGELTCGKKDLNDTYTDWKTETDKKSKMNEFMTRFASALREEIDVSNLAHQAMVEATTTGEGENEVTTASFDKLDDGYWIVTSTIGTKSAVFTVAGSKAEINEKNEAPSLTKTVWDEDGNSYAGANDVFYDGLVKYEVKITAGAGTENLKLVDTLSEGLTFVEIESITFNPKGERPVYPASNDVDSKGNKVETMTAGVNLKDSSAIGDDMATPSEANGNKLEIPFTESFLKSLRINMAGENPADGTGPMVTGDKRLATKQYDKEHAAYYNVFLGDMETMEDDGGTIVVVYTARVNDKAFKTNSVNNTAYLEYGHDPANPIKTGEKKTETHIYDLTIDKYAYGDPNAKLAGADFQLTYFNGADINGKDSAVTYNEGKLAFDATRKDEFGDTKTDEKDTTYKQVCRLVEITDESSAETDDRIYRVATKADQDAGKTILDAATTGTSGKAIIKGLDGGLYSLKETKAPAGYNALDEDAMVVLGNQFAKIGDKLFTKDEEQSTDSKIVFAEKENKMVSIANNSGIVMPVTGGMGTTVFYIVGVALILGAGVLLIIKKRSAREN